MVLAARAKAPAARVVGFAPFVRSCGDFAGERTNTGFFAALEARSDMRLASVGAATAAGLLGIGLVTGALLVVATVAAERTLVRGVSARLLGRK